MKRKIMLAYSGGLDTSVIIPWLHEHYDCEIIAYCGDVGVGVDPCFLKNKALKLGAVECIVEDLSRPFIEDYIYPVLKAGAVYENVYYLGTSMARPLIARRLVHFARERGCDSICHGCTGKGNDQVRFELAFQALAPDLEIIAPWRFWEIKSREEELNYAEKNAVPVPVTHEENYSMDQNIWHLSHEGMDLESPANEARLEHLLKLMLPPQKAEEKGEYVTIHFEKGVPVQVDNVSGNLEMLTYLNKKAGRHGIGLQDLVENRLVGMKSRGVYETPGGTVYFKAHELLEQVCLEKETLHYKQGLALRYADLVYNGQWFHPLREAMQAFVNETQKTVSGSVKLFLYKGNMLPAGTSSPYSLYDEAIASFGEEDVYNQADATGFIRLFGLPGKIYGRMKQQNGLDK